MSDYLNKHALYPPLIETAPDPELQLVIVIPAYDELGWQDSLASLARCTPCRKAVEVILLINDAETTAEVVKKRHQQQYVAAKAWAEQQQLTHLRFYPLYCSNLARKHAGVGLARKIGMDEAVRRLEAVGRPEGIIVGFDADSLCDANYLQAIEQYFDQAPHCSAASIYYEHPIEGEAYEPAIYEAIIQYELHLRYFNNAKRYAGFPHAYETIGSAMAVRASAYQQQGGMNRRKAGEDFYFLNKFTALGTFGEINTTRVIPSPRPSERVPFGTGRAVGQLLQQGQPLTTYAPAAFEALKQLFTSANRFYRIQPTALKSLLDQLPVVITQFLEQQQFVTKLEELNRNTSSILAFEKRFFQWFNPFLIMKYVHFARDHYYPNVTVREAANWLMENYLKVEMGTKTGLEDYLGAFREWDRRRRS